MYLAKESRYDVMQYRPCGKSGLKLPLFSLGLWQNFGAGSVFSNAEEMCRTAFDLGVTHFDLANNYGHPYRGTAEENFGRILDRGMRKYREEMVISTKAGYEMWPGPYGTKNGCRKYLITSLDQSLSRMKLDYVDIFYHHVFDPETPLEEVALALDQTVRSGKALYVGVSNYNKAQTAEITAIFKELRTPFIVNQPSYAMLNRWIEDDGLDVWAKENGIGISVFSPLYQGILTDKYLNGVPAGSRVAKANTSAVDKLTAEAVEKSRKLNEIAKERGQSLAQMALCWVLANPAVTTVLMGASRPEQITENVAAMSHLTFTDEEMARIREIL